MAPAADDQELASAPAAAAAPVKAGAPDLVLEAGLVDEAHMEADRDLPGPVKASDQAADPESVLDGQVFALSKPFDCVN